MTTTAIVNVGAMVSGDVRAPLHRATGVLIENGRIAAVGPDAAAVARAGTVIDARSMTLIPGLIDSHTRPVPEAVFGLLERLAQRGHRPAATLEWDRDFPPFEELLAPLARARGLLAGPPAVEIVLPAAVPAAADADLAAFQSLLAEALLSHEAKPVPGVAPEVVARFARGLAEKRELYAVKEPRRRLPAWAARLVGPITIG
jgi:hypothetical protein